MLTNRFGLPAALVAAIEKHSHKGAEYSASMLTNSPRQVWLKKRHEAEAVEDASDKVWSALGTAFHNLMHEHAEPNALSEEYMEETFGGIVVSATADVYAAKGKLTDYKTTNVYAVSKGSRIPEWTAQVNVYALYTERRGFPVKDAEVVAILRDWMASRTSDPNYPRVMVLVIPIEIWPKEKQEAFIVERVRAFEAHRETPDDKLPFCTEDERWNGKKCERYCVGQAWCNQRQAELKNVTPKADGPFTVKAKTPKKAGKVRAA